MDILDDKGVSKLFKFSKVNSSFK